MLRRCAPAAELEVIDSGPGELDDSVLRLAQTPMARGVLIGSAQILALLPGISRWHHDGGRADARFESR
jgi:undecaprenyl-diphosphatase